MRATLALLTTALALAACAKSETPEEARAAAQRAYSAFDARAEEARADDELDNMGGGSPGQINTAGAMTPGSWSMASVEGERMARFGEAEGDPVITISCEVGGGIDMRLPGLAPPGGSSTVNISSPEGSSTFTASDTIADAPETYISVPSSDPFIGRLVSGVGPFALRMGSDQRIVFPADDVLTSVVSACDRRSAARATIDSGSPDRAAPTTPAPITPAPQSGTGR